MELLLFAAAVLVVLGAPALAAVVWLRSVDAAADSIDCVAVAYGGLAVSALSIWMVSGLAGPSPRMVLLASLAGAAVLMVPPWARRRSPPPASEEAPTKGVEAPKGNGDFALLAGAAAVFALLASLPFLPYGWERADGVHRMAMSDWYKHIVTTSALTASDVFPPANPFVHVAESAPYYYGFHLVGASVARVAGALSDAEVAGNLVYPALLLLTLGTAAATPFVVYSVARVTTADRRGGAGGGGAGGRARVPLIAAVGGTFLAGFDLVPLALDTLANVVSGGATGGGWAAVRGAIPSTHLDYWIHHNERQFNAPYLTAIWAPQHLAGVLVALLVVYLVLRRRLESERRGDRSGLAGGWLLPALLLAGLPALSAYVALGLAAAVLGATLVDSLRGRIALWRTESWRIWFLPAALAAVLSLPVVVVVGSGDGSGLTVHVSEAGRWVNGAVWSSLFGANWLTGLLDTAAVYVVEFGVLGVLALLEIRRSARQRRLPAHQRHVVAIVATLLFFVAFVRPAVGGPNNLYARPLVFAWFLLAPFAAMRFARADKARWTIAGIVLCLLANGYALVGVLLEGSLFWATPASTVAASRWINDNAPADAVVAIAPEDFVSGFGYWLRRPLALADERHALLFGASLEVYERAATALRQGVSGGVASAAAATDATGGTLLLLPREAASGAGWPQTPCFERVHDNEAWIVLARTSVSCSAER